MSDEIHHRCAAVAMQLAARSAGDGPARAATLGAFPASYHATFEDLVALA